MPIPALIDGWTRFRDGRFRDQRALFERLHREGQQPHIAMVACCDSRVDPAIVFGCDPGDLFVLRNVANLVPPCEEAGRYHGTSAALEFAVAMLGVAHVVVLGHAHCGGIAALLAEAGPAKQSTRFLASWMGLAEEARAAALTSPLGGRARVLLCEQMAIRLSMRNLQTFPWVRERIALGNLWLHGWHFDTGNAELTVLDQATDRFTSATEFAKGYPPRSS